MVPPMVEGRERKWQKAAEQVKRKVRSADSAAMPKRSEEIFTLRTHVSVRRILR